MYQMRKITHDCNYYFFYIYNIKKNKEIILNLIFFSHCLYLISLGNMSINKAKAEEKNIRISLFF